MGLYNPVDYREPQARARLFGGEVGIEHMHQVFPLDASSGIRDDDRYRTRFFINRGIYAKRTSMVFIVIPWSWIWF
jgi:hypothetical protein